MNSSSTNDPRRVLHLPVSYLPWTVGGKEVYTDSLARNLAERGWRSDIAFHQNHGAREPVGSHLRDATRVEVLPPLTLSRSAVYDCAPAEIPGFENLLRNFQPAVVHFHDFSSGASLRHLRAARACGARTVMTYHSPGQSCLQRSLLYRGRTICDGQIETSRCTECRLSAAGMPAWLATAVSALPSARWLENSQNLLTRSATAKAMTQSFQAAWLEMVEQIDAIQVLSQWSWELMRRNHVPADKLHLIRSGVGMDIDFASDKAPAACEPLRLAYVGRCDEVKGVALLVEAVLRLPPEINVQVSLLGPYWDSPYAQRILSRLGGDPRFLPPRLVTPHDIVNQLKTVDACVVPSVWLETGPLVVYEAFAAGIPVIGTRLGGISELVRDNIDGLLFPRGDVAALRQIIELLANQRERLNQLKANVRRPRTMAEAAAATAALYDRITGVDRKRRSTDQRLARLS